MTIRELQKSFMIHASMLGDYEGMTKSQLANGYCDAEEAGNEPLRSAYYAALMLRYWYRIFEWERTSKSLQLELEDFVVWLDECLQDALYYRSWRPLRQIEKDPITKRFIGPYVTNPQYQANDPDAADRSINFFCKAKRGKEYQAYNKDRRRANVQTLSIDACLEENGDGVLQYAGAYEDPKMINKIYYLVKHFLDKDQTIEALIIDGIANFESYKTIKTTNIVKEVDENGVEYEVKQPRYKTNFDSRKLVKHLNSIDNKFMVEYFSKEYKLNTEESQSILTKLSSLNNTKLYKYIEKVLIQLRTNSELLGYLI